MTTKQQIKKQKTKKQTIQATGILAIALGYLGLLGQLSASTLPDNINTNRTVYRCPGHPNPSLSLRNRRYHPENMTWCSGPFGCMGRGQQPTHRQVVRPADGDSLMSGNTKNIKKAG